MSESLKIAFYTDTFLPAVDGVVISILNFKRELEKRGHEVHLYASGTERTKQLAKKYKNIEVVRGISFRRYPQYNVALFPLGSRLRTMSLRMDINHAHTPFTMGIYSLLLSRLDKTPIVGSFHTLFTDSSVIKEYVVGNRRMTKTLTKYSWKYAKMFYNRCDGVAAPSESIRRMLNKRGIRNVDVIANGVDVKKFNPEVSGMKARKRFVKRGERLVMYVGRLSKEKRLETLLKAAKILKKDNIKFAIVGTGPAEGHYRHMVEHMNLQDMVRFTGFINNSELPKYYAACDAFCIPSTFETQGVVSLEAMAVGKPVIGANYLALRDLIKDGKNGEKFKPNDSEDCAKKIKKVINNIDSYKEMRTTAKRYSVESTTTDLLGLYRRILNNEYS